VFDIGFWELLLVFVVALVILGPERLPQVAAKAGRWMANARAIVRNLRAQIEAELAQQKQAPSEPGGSEPAPDAARTGDEKKG
jgi:sec-independent protein translocase protein TatB